MAGSAINWESLAREDAIGPIVSSGRYRLDSPSTVTGSPTFAMAAAGQSATIRVFLPSGQSVETPISVSGTTAAPLVNQVGKPFSQSELALVEIEVTMPYGQNLLTTDEPNGSPSAPFQSTDERTAWATANLATLLPGRTTVWGPGASTEYVWNGPLATDWQGIRGPYLGSAENPFPSYAALPAPSASNIGVAYIPDLAGTGLIKMVNDNGAAWKPERGTSPLCDLIDPFVVSAPGDIAAHDYTIITLPGGLWKDKDVYDFQLTFETAANTGADTCALILNGLAILPYATPASTMGPLNIKLRRDAANLKRILVQYPLGLSTQVGTYGIDADSAVTVGARITCANGANTTYLRRAFIVRS